MSSATPSPELGGDDLVGIVPSFEAVQNQWRAVGGYGCAR
jgi:hypothetical protein